MTSSTRAGSRSLRSTRARSGCGGQVDRVPAGEPAVLLAHRGADDIDDHSVRHGTIVPDSPDCRKSGGVSDFSCPPTLRRTGLDPDPTTEQWTTCDSPDRRPDGPAIHRLTRRRSGPRPAPGWPPTPRPGSLPSLDTADGFEAHRAWERHGADRWSVVSWPEEYGGPGGRAPRVADLRGGVLAGRAPTRVSQNGIFLLAPTLFEFGTDEQQAASCPPWPPGEEIWCQGWSEPDAGSDLAGIRSRAARAPA